MAKAAGVKTQEVGLSHLNPCPCPLHPLPSEASICAPGPKAPAEPPCPRKVLEEPVPVGQGAWAWPGRGERSALRGMNGVRTWGAVSCRFEPPRVTCF